MMTAAGSEKPNEFSDKDVVLGFSLLSNCVQIYEAVNLQLKINL